MNQQDDNMLSAVARAMDSQTVAYEQLSSITKRLSAALIASELSSIEELTRQGERELTQMRSCLLEIMTKLTSFAEERAKSNEKLETHIKETFEASAKQLIDCAREFQSVSVKANGLAMSGTSFTNACVQQIGVPASTYKKPIMRYTEASRR